MPQLRAEDVDPIAAPLRDTPRTEYLLKQARRRARRLSLVATIVFIAGIPSILLAAYLKGTASRLDPFAFDVFGWLGIAMAFALGLELGAHWVKPE